MGSHTLQVMRPQPISSSSAGISCSGLVKRFGDTEVLRGVDLSVAPGETIAVIGASGSGKSTLCRVLIGLETLHAGEILVDSALYCRRDLGDRKIKWGPDRRALARSMGMVFQHFTLFSHLSVMNNVTLAPRKVLELPRAEAEQRAKALLERVGLEDKIDSYPSQLSGGQKQRAAIARELAMERRILFFDEVTSALDPMLVAEVLQVMRELADTGITMIVVTHEMNFARNAADRIVFMHDGTICEQGPPDRILDDPQTEPLQRFLGKILH